MTAWFLQGERQDELWQELNDRGITTSTGKPWTQATVKQVLKRPRNAGIVEYKGQHVGKLPGVAIVDPADYDKLIAKYAARRRSARP